MRNFILKTTILLILCHKVFAVEIKALTFNIAALNPFSLSTNERITRFCDSVVKKKYDVLFIQEAWITKFRKQIIKECKYPFYVDLDGLSGIKRRVISKELTSLKTIILSSIIDFIFPNIGGDSGLIILSKYPLRNEKKLVFSVNGSEDNLLDGEVAVNKGAISATLLHPRAGQVHVATTHLIANYKDTTYDEHREQQLLELQEWIKLNAKGLPTLVGGDFNISPPTSQGQRRLRTERMWHNFKYKYFKDYSFLNKDYSLLTTFPRKGNSFNEGVLDHIIGLNGLIPISNRIIKNQGISDHFALESILRLIR